MMKKTAPVFGATTAFISCNDNRIQRKTLRNAAFRAAIFFWALCCVLLGLGLAGGAVAPHPLSGCATLPMPPY